MTRVVRAVCLCRSGLELATLNPGVATALGLNPRASAGIEDELLCHGSYREWLRLMSRD